MKLTKWFLATSAALLFLLSLSVCVCASDAVIPFDDFESYEDSIGGNWRAQGRYTKAPLVVTEKGKSIMAESVPGGMLEIIQDFPETPADAENFGIAFAMKFDNFNAQRSIYTRNSAGEYDIFKISKNGKVVIAETELNDIILQTGIWYNFYLEYNSVKGYIRLNISDGRDNVTISNFIATKQRTALTRLDFVSSAPAEGASVTYIDNVAFYILDYVVEPYKEEIGNELIPFNDFESYASDFNFPRNQTAAHLEEWTFQNDVKNMKVTETDRGQSAYIEPAGWTGFMYGSTAWNVPDSLTLKFSVKPIKLGNFIKVCMIYQSDATRRFPFQINADGTIMVFDTTYPATTFKVETGHWYDVSIEYSIIGISKVSISGNGSSAELEAYGASIPNVTRLSILSGNGAAYYLDDIEMTKIESESDIKPDATGVASISPSVGYVDNGEIVVSFDGAMYDYLLPGVYAKVNGSDEYVESIELIDDKIVVKLSPDIPQNGTFFFELGDLWLGDNKIGASTVFFTRKSFDIISFDTAVTGTTTESTLVVVSKENEPRNVSLVTILYNDETGAMVAADFAECTVENSTSELKTQVTAPDDGSYTAISHIWDSVKNMRSLNMKRINK
ncbi:MAG: hypothetical protein II998_12635 [Clostridia bacterium]|nr:hypothetical protein [Clostridia bacterium]